MLSLEEIERELQDEFLVAGLAVDGPPYADEGWPLARELAYRCAVRLSEKQNAPVSSCTDVKP